MYKRQEFIQINTRNILFICGGAFDGLDKIIERRTDKRGIGFDSQLQSKKDRDVGAILKEVPVSYTHLDVYKRQTGR